MDPASGMILSDGLGVNKNRFVQKLTKRFYFAKFSGSGIGFHLFKISLKSISPIGERSESVSGKVRLVEPRIERSCRLAHTVLFGGDSVDLRAAARFLHYRFGKIRS